MTLNGGFPELLEVLCPAQAANQKLLSGAYEDSPRGVLGTAGSRVQNSVQIDFVMPNPMYGSWEHKNMSFPTPE